MDPKWGRFARIDPHSGRIARPITLHKYLYGDNDPINRRDPSGRFSLLGISGTQLAAIAVVGAGGLLLDNTLSLPHYYNHTNVICSWVNEGCTPKNVFNALLHFPAPIGTLSYGLGRAVRSGEKLPLWGLFSPNPVLTTHNGVDAVKNVSLPPHIFQGTVDRRVVTGSFFISINTMGFNSSGRRAVTNMLAAPFIWKVIDGAISMSILMDVGHD